MDADARPAPPPRSGAVAAHDLTQKKHAILRNFPVVGHLRFTLERFGPELRQYIVTVERRGAAVQPRPAALGLRVVQAGEQLLRLRHRQRRRERRGLPDHQAPHVRRSRAPTASHAHEEASLPSGQGARRAAGPAPRVPARVGGQRLGDELRRAVRATPSRRSTAGAAMAGCLHNTGEGALSSYHRNGGDLVFQIGTGYFGCRDDDGDFDLARLKDLVASAPVRAIEIKLSQGAKPGLGGMLPGRQGQRRDRRDPRHRAGRGLRLAEPAPGVLRRRLDARLRRDWSPRRPGCPSASSPRSATWSSGTTSCGSWPREQPRRRLRQRRRRRGRHRRRADDLRRRRRLPVPGRLRPGLPAVRRGRAHRRRHLHRRRQARHPRERRRRLRARRRHGQRRPRGDARRSAASRRRSATPTTARSAWRPRTRATPGAWTRP